MSLPATARAASSGAHRDGTDEMAVCLARAECEARLEAGHPMRAVEAYIDALPAEDHVRRSLWLWAWAYGERTLPR